VVVVEVGGVVVVEVVVVSNKTTINKGKSYE
jgi:hypothetical protein